MRPSDKHVQDQLSEPRESTNILLLEQREANKNLLVAALRNQEEAEKANSTKANIEVELEEVRAVAQELSETAEFRERLLGIIGHDLRSPLNAIVMSAGLLLSRGQLAEDDLQTAARIVSSSQRMNRMISTLLEFTRARLGGGFPLQSKHGDLRPIFRDVVDELAVTASSEVKYNFEGDLTGEWDVDRLAQVVSNLAGNALDHASPGTPIELRAHNDGPDVVLEISNQGQPIPEDLMAVIFLPFRRGRPHHQPKSGHLGLGLYIAHEVVASHGGSLNARCANGITTFTVRLPRGGTP